MHLGWSGKHISDMMDEDKMDEDKNEDKLQTDKHLIDSRPIDCHQIFEGKLLIYKHMIRERHTVWCVLSLSFLK